MSFKHVARIVCSLFLILTATQLYASESDTERVFDWAESQYPSIFTPATETQSLETWQFRYYSATNVYIGINNGTEVYLLGEIFGGLMYVASVSDLLQLLPWLRTFHPWCEIPATTKESQYLRQKMAQDIQEALRNYEQ